mmetsp:Transcript_17939/g.38790  ORF Transcript_17939/g.38790 Transcript_17939/m.38790 type:complete len:385 (-) Transcript_17939:510-1664(-)
MNRRGNRIGVERLADPDAPPVKQLFIVRHAQSKWNAAQKSRDVRTLLAYRDHPLTQRGCDQAEALAAAITSVMRNGPENEHFAGRKVLAGLMKADAIWSSPHTRALQTALIGLRPLHTSPMPTSPTPSPSAGRAATTPATAGAETAAAAADGAPAYEASASGSISRETGNEDAQKGSTLPIRLKPAAREKKNLGGFDTIGVCRGERCLLRAMSELQPHVPADTLEQMRFTCVEATEVERKWWSGMRDSKQQLHQRMAALLEEIRASPHSSIVLVGHSHFFREFFRAYLNDKWREASPHVATDLCKHRIPNCSVACCQIDFSVGPQVVTDVSLYSPDVYVKLTAGASNPTLCVKGEPVSPTANAALRLYARQPFAPITVAGQEVL